MPAPSSTTVSTLERTVAPRTGTAGGSLQGQGLERGAACSSSGSSACTMTVCTTTMDQRRPVLGANRTPITDLDAELRRRVQRIRLRAH